MELSDKNDRWNLWSTGSLHLNEMKLIEEILGNPSLNKHNSAVKPCLNSSLNALT